MCEGSQPNISPRYVINNQDDIKSDTNGGYHQHISDDDFMSRSKSTKLSVLEDLWIIDLKWT